MMRTFLFTLTLLLAAPFAGAAQKISGTVYDSSTGEPVGYVNIGIVGTNTGTVSGSRGAYSLGIDEELRNDTIRFSCIGYRPFEARVSDFLSSENFDVMLTEDNVSIREVVVRPSVYERKKLGNDYRGNQIVLHADSARRGFEFGVLLKFRKRAVLEEVSLNIGGCSYPEMTFRINIYRQTGRDEFENILHEPIYATYVNGGGDGEGTLVADLASRDLVVEGNILVAYQHIEEDESGSLTIPSRLSGTRCYMRKSVNAAWEKPPLNMKVPIMVTALVEK